MKGSLKKLYEEFLLIQGKWVKSEVLDKILDNNYLTGILIKKKFIYSDYPIGLFNAVLDNKQMDDLFIRYSWRCPRNGGENKLYDVIDTKKYSNIHRNYAFRLSVDWSSEKVNLLIYNNYAKLAIKSNFAWTYQSLKLKLNKISYLVIFHYDRYTDINTNEVYFKYLDMTIYKLKSTVLFLELIDQGIIKIELKMIKYEDTINKGYFRNKEAIFTIDEENLSKLFTKINI